jgi:hypothetical protein
MGCLGVFRTAVLTTQSTLAKENEPRKEFLVDEDTSKCKRERKCIISSTLGKQWD